MNTHKTCIRCLTAYPRTPEYFYRNKSYLRYGDKDGLQPYCKSCDDSKRLEHRIDNYEHELKRGRDINSRWKKGSGREKHNAYNRKKYRERMEIK